MSDDPTTEKMPAQPTKLSDRDRFDKFTERARMALNFSQEEAQRFNHNYIGTEHLLLGLVRVEDGTAIKVLSNLGVELNQVRSAVEFIIARGDRIVLGDIGLTPRAKKVIELAVDEARRLNHHYIGTEHLLLGLVREGEGIAAGVLEALAVNLKKLRTQTIQVLSQTSLAVGATDSHEKHSKTPTIDQMGIELTSQARANKLDPIIGREKEIERVIQILSRFQKSNPVLIGEPGMDKTAIVEGLAQRIISGEVPETLQGKRLLTLDVGSLVANVRDRGEFEERLKKIIEEIRSSQDCIIFIDEVHTWIAAPTTASAAEGAVDAASILKPALSRGELQCIGATTLDEYRKYIEKDAALQRRFQPVYVSEPTIEETIFILKGIREKYEQHHRLTITDEALRAAVEMGSRYITDRFLPDKAIDLIDEAASRVRMQRSLAPLNLKEATRGLEAVLREKDEAIQNQNYQHAAELRDREVKLRERIRKLESGWQRDQGTEKPVVGEEDIAQIVSMWTGIPVMRLVTSGETGAPVLEAEAEDGKHPLAGERSSPRTLPSNDHAEQAKIFISYSHEDKDWCASLANVLIRVGYDVWYDYHLAAGAPWIEEIESQIRQRTVFVVLVSPEALSSHWVRNELHLAMRLQRKIIPLRVRPTSLDSNFLGNLQIVDAVNQDSHAAAANLLHELTSLSY